MSQQTRRAFVTSAVTLGTAAAASAMTASTSLKPKLVHHVFFWLKNPDSKEDLAKLMAGIRTLEKIETVRGLHVGVPASTEKRDVVEASYSASELLFFDDIEGQNRYQTDPIHLKFVEECSALWKRVVVYDSLAV